MEHANRKALNHFRCSYALSKGFLLQAYSLDNFASGCGLKILAEENH